MAPAAVTLILPTRSDGEVAFVHVAVNLPPFTPEAGVIVSHGWSDVADHVGWLVVTVTSLLSASALGNIELCDKVTLAAAWVTVKVASALPAVTLTVPVRAAAEVFVVADTVKLPPLAPEPGDTVSHDAS